MRLRTLLPVLVCLLVAAPLSSSQAMPHSLRRTLPRTPTTDAASRSIDPLGLARGVRPGLRSTERAARTSLLQLGATREQLAAETAGSASGLLLFSGGDLDGDGMTDLVGVDATGPSGETTAQTMRIAAIKGNTGAELWTHSEDATFVFPIAEPLGPDAKPGILAVAITITSQVSGDTETDNETLHLLALSGTGGTLWEQTYQGELVASPAGTTATGLPGLGGLMFADAGGTTDVLVGLLTATAPSSGPITVHTEADVVSGTDGSTISTGTMDDTDREPTPYAVADLSGDGHDDYAFVSAGLQSPMTVSARGGLDGREIWNNATLDGVLPTFALDPGDVTGDGKADALIWSFQGPGGSGPSPGPISSISLLDGADGHLIWSKRVDFPIPLGDIDGDGNSEIGSVTMFTTPSREGVRYSAFGAETTPIYSKAYGVPLPSASSASSSVSVAAPIGDVDSDGTPDFQHAIRATNHDTHRTRSNDGVVSGKAGTLLWPGTNAFPVLGSIDGIGDDFVRIVRPKRRPGIILKALHGESGLAIWTRPLSVQRRAQFLPFAVDVTGDGRAEVVLQRLVQRSDGSVAIHTNVISSAGVPILWSA